MSTRTPVENSANVESTTPVRALNGNRLALVGAILYLLEFAFIIPSGLQDIPTFADPAEISAAYAAQPASGIALLVAGLNLALLGRIAFVAGLRSALRQTNETRALGDFALGAMVVSVVFELAGYAVFGATTRMAAEGVDPGVLAALHESFRGLGFAFPPALGASILAASLAMLLSRQFPRWLGVLGLLAGVGWLGSGFYFALINDVIVAFTGPIWLGWVAWLLSTGVILFRRAGPISLRRPPDGRAA